MANISAATKYYVLTALTIISAVLTYITAQPVITEGVLIGATLLGVTMAIHDLEPSPTATQSTTK